jgi:heme exporter protein C
MFQALANPHRFMAVSRWLAPVLGAIAVALIGAGLVMAAGAPPERYQGTAVRILYLHVPSAIVAEVSYMALGAASFISFVFRHALADAASKAAAPLGAGFTLLALVTGSLWGATTWGTPWQWDARMTSVLILFLLFVGYMALRASIDDETRAGRAAAILAMVGSLDLLVIKYSVEPPSWLPPLYKQLTGGELVWWNSLHQGESIFSGEMAPAFLTPLLLMIGGFLAAFGALWLVRIRAEVWSRRAQSLALQAAGA